MTAFIRLVMLGLVLVAARPCHGQTESLALKQWEKVYGRASTDRFRGLQSTTDGGLVFGGLSYSGLDLNNLPFGFGGADFLVFKTDASGNKIWERSFGGDDNDFLKTIQATSDGGFVLAGDSRSNTNGNKTSPNYGIEDYWIVKLDGAGVKQWEQSFGGNAEDILGSVIATSDGGTLLWGTSDSNLSGNKTTPGYGSRDYWIVKFDSNGARQWERTFGGDNIDLLQTALQTSDGGFILGGDSYSGITGNKTVPAFGGGDYWIIKLDSGGNKQWEKVYGGDGWEDLISILPTADGGYLLGGSSQSAISGNKTAANFGNFDYWIVKLDSNGNAQWNKTFGGNSEDSLRAMALTSDGYYLLAGEAESGTSSMGNKTTPNYGGRELWFVKVDVNGAKVWDKGIAGFNDSFLAQLRPTSDGGFVAAGSSSSAASGNKTSPNYGGLDYLVARFNSNGIKLWEQSFGGAQDDQLGLALPVAGGYILGGESFSDVSGNKTTPRIREDDFWLIKLAERSAPAGTPVVKVNDLFVPSGGVTNSGPVQIQIETSFTNGLIYYTLDGSQPATTSTRYTQPFTLAQSATVRAIAYTFNLSNSAEAEVVTILIASSYSLVVTVAGDGVVTLDPPGGAYISNSVVTVTPTPRGGWDFVGWSGDASGTQTPLTVVMNTNKAITARFERIWTLSVNEGTGGNVTRVPDLPFYLNNATVTLTAFAQSNFVFTGWSGDATGLNNPTTVLMTTNRSATAHFASTRLSVDIVGNGTVTRSPNKAFYGAGDVVDVTPIAGAYYAFSHWADGLADNPRSVVIGANNHYVAIFTNTILLTAGRLKQWEKDFGGRLEDNLSQVVATTDGGYLLAGSSNSGLTGNKGKAGFGDFDYWIIKLDADGNKQWEQVFGGTGFDALLDARQTADGGYILAGYSDSTASGNKTAPHYGRLDFWIVKTDGNGAKLWDRSFGGAENDLLYSVQQTSDGGYILGGASDSYISGNKSSRLYGSRDYWVIKVDHDGVKQWEQTFGGQSDDQLYDVVPAGDGGYVLSGFSNSDRTGTKKAPIYGAPDFWLVKIDSQGREQWEQTYGGNNTDTPTVLRPTSDGGYIVGGYSDSPVSGNKTVANHGHIDFWVLKLDSSGDKQWERTFGAEGDSLLTALQQTVDGGYVLGGFSNAATNNLKTVASYGEHDFWVIKIDQAGTIQWQQDYGGDNRDTLYGLQLTGDGGLVLAGGSSSALSGNKSTISYGGSSDFWVVKLAINELPFGTPVVLVNGEYHPENNHVVIDAARVELLSGFTNGAIYYTVNGAPPNTGATRYVSPFTVQSNTILRAIAYNSSGTQSAEAVPVQINVVADPPQVLSIAALSGSAIIGVCFDQAIGTSATNPANYSLGGGATVTSATLRSDTKTVLLTYSGTLGTNFTLTVNNVTDPAGTPIAANSTTAGIALLLTDTDIGGPAVGGSSFSCTPAEIEVRAGGAGIGGPADSFRFTYGGRAGDFDVAVQVENPGLGALAGLMARENGSAGSRHLSALVSRPADSATWFPLMRAAQNGDTTLWPSVVNPGFAASPNVWVRLRREGNTFTAYYGTNGLTWTQLAQATPTPAYPNSVSVGLATTASDNLPSAATTVLYRNFKDLPPPPPKTDDDNWDDRFGIPNIFNDVYALGLTDLGELYAGGAFLGNAFGAGGGLNANFVARWNGRAWSRLGVQGTNGTGGFVRAIAIKGTDTYIAGEFGAVYDPSTGGYAVNSIARWDGVRWRRVGTDANFGVIGQVYALAVHNNDLYVAGQFSSAGGASAVNVAKWNGQQWSALGPGLGNPQGNRVTALAVAGDGTVYAGGNFTNSGSVAASRIAKWNGSGWLPLASGVDNTVAAIAINGNNVYVAGIFGQAGGVPAKRLAKWNGTDWSEVGGGMTGGDAYALAVEGDNLYVGGSFTEARGVPLFGIGIWDGANWTALGPGVSGGSGVIPATVFAIQVKDGTVYAGGSFDTAGDVYAPRMARWDGSRWSAVNQALAFSGPPSSSVVAVRGTNVYVGGDFFAAGGVRANGIARWRGNEWSALGGGPNNGVNGRVLSIAVSPNGHVFAGGEFTVAGGIAAKRMARWDGTAWSGLGEGIQPANDLGLIAVRAIAIDARGDVFAAGSFTVAGHVSATNIARWDGTQWNPLGRGVNDLALALAISGNNLYVGGAFSQAGGQTVNGIARWDGTNWFALGSGVAFPGFQPSVSAIGIRGSELFIGGAFSQAGGKAANRLARWDGSGWFAFGGGTDGNIRSIVSFGADLFAAGDFTSIGGKTIAALARWDGTEWFALGSGLGVDSPRATSLAVSGTELFVGGGLTEAGRKPSTGFARWALDNNAPTVTVTNPPAGAGFAFRANIPIGAAAADNDGTVSKVEFYANAELIGSAGASPYGMTWSNVFTGDYLLVARATDNLGAMADSTGVLVRVLPPTNDIPPTVSISSPTNGASSVGGANVGLAADAMDSDGAVVRVDFYQGNSLIGTAATPPFSVTWSNVLVGGYSLTAVATDELGARTVSEPVSISVIRPNSRPFVNFNNPPDGAVFTQPTNILIDVGSSDNDGQVILLELLANDSLLAVLTGSDRYSFVWTNAPPNVYTLTARATDDAGATASATVGIVVNGSDRDSVAQAIPPNAPKQNFWVTDGPVRAIVEKNGIVYIGGEFTHIGQYVQGNVLLDLASNPPDFTHPIVNGSVKVIQSDGTGGYYLGGVFTSVAGVARTNLAHVRGDRTVDLDWAPVSDAAATTLTLLGDSLFVGGDFTRVNGQVRNRLAALDARNGSLLNWAPAPDNVVHALAAGNNTVYACGQFRNIGGQPHNYIAALDAATGLAGTWNPNADDVVSVMTLANGQLYVAGNFRNIGGQLRIHLAGLDLVAGTATAFNPGSNGEIKSMAADSGVVYVAGVFDQIGGQNRYNIAALDAVNGQASPWNPNPNGPITGMVLSSNVVYAAGQFDNIGGQLRNHLGAVSGVTGLATDLDLKTAGNVFAFGVSGGKVLAAGSGTLIQVPRNRLAAVDAATGIATDWNPDLNGTVYALAASGNTVYAGGGFTRVGGQTRNNLVAVDAVTGAATSWAPDPSSGVRALALSSNTVYVGGGFVEIGGASRFYIAALDANTGAATSWNPGANEVVYALVVSSNAVYAAGDFSSIGGKARGHIAALDVLTGAALDWNPNANGFVRSLAWGDGTLYAAGVFNRIGGRARSAVAALNPTTSQALVWSADADGGVLALASAHSTLFAGGQYAFVGGKSRTHLAGLDTRINFNNATAWSPTISDPPLASSVIYSVCATPETLYVGGNARFGAESRPYLAAYDFPPRLESTRRPANGQLEFDVRGADGKFYFLEISTNLLSWSRTLTNYGPFTLQDTGLTNVTRRFYRVTTSE